MKTQRENIKKYESSINSIKEEKEVMWPFKDKNTQKGVSIVLIIGGLFSIFADPFPKSFFVGAILIFFGLLYLLDIS